MKIAILASQEGTTLQAILDACSSGELDAEPCVVISNNSRSGAMRRANAAGVTTVHLSAKTHPDDGQRDQAMLTALEASGTQLVVTAGYMKKLGPLTLDAFHRRIINVHPSLLPRHGGLGMFGRHVFEAVIASGDRVTGATVHYLDGDYDTGDIISHVEIPVLDDDTAETLADRQRAIEHNLLINSIRTLSQCQHPTEKKNAPQ